MRRGGFTIVEILVSLGIVTLLIAIIYSTFHYIFGTNSRHSLTSLTRRSFVQKDARAGLRRLIYRLREGIQIVEPLPGRGGTTLVFRDITNQKIRIRLDSTQHKVVSERESGSAWVFESTPTLVQAGNGTLPASWPVSMSNCTSLHFTVLSPESVSIAASLVSEGQTGTYMTVIKLRNAYLSL